MQRKMTLKLPIANILNTASRGIAVTAISGYQKFISPHKGFICAHRVLYGCESCSQYFKRVIAEEGIFEAIANAKGRFQECREANEIVKNRRAKRKIEQKHYANRMMAIEPDNPDNSNLPEESDIPNSIGGSQWDRKKRSQTNNRENNNNNNNCDYFNSCFDCADLLNAIPSDCGNSRHCGDADCLSGMDCSGLDCGSLDCGSLDCSGADCGSCG
jgi:putative component of membrane protein insertase Oxa1/YidC/SpoIIIJ protein YidD